MKNLNYRMHSGRRHEPRYRGSVAILLTIMALVIIFCRVVKVDAESTANTKVEAIKEVHEIVLNKNEALIKDNEALKAKLENSAKVETSETVKAIAREYIRKYFPKSEWENAEKITTCESNMNNLTVNWANKDGSTDRGFWQINSIHKTNFKKITGMDYEIGAHDFDASTKFARWLWDHSGFNPWVCRLLI